MFEWRALVVSVLTALAAAGCASVADGGPRPAPESSAPADGPASSPSPSEDTTATSAPTVPRRTLRYRIEVRDDRLDLGAVRREVEAILTDSRGWHRAGVDAVLVPASDSAAEVDATITVADGVTIDQRCLPYDTRGRYSCQLGDTVNLNADRWLFATPEWTGDLAAYRTYLVNHEVGHLLGLHHPSPQCPGPGYPAPIMLQQSTELGSCTANPWPLTWEIDLVVSGVEPFAPGYEPDPTGRPSPPPVRS